MRRNLGFCALLLALAGVGCNKAPNAPEVVATMPNSPFSQRGLDNRKMLTLKPEQVAKTREQIEEWIESHLDDPQTVEWFDDFDAWSTHQVGGELAERYYNVRVRFRVTNGQSERKLYNLTFKIEPDNVKMVQQNSNLD